MGDLEGNWKTEREGWEGQDERLKGQDGGLRVQVGRLGGQDERGRRRECD